METLFSLRRYLFGLRKRYLQKRKPYFIPYKPGLPEGISAPVLKTICLDHFDEKPVSFANQHLSGWKPSGAYRLSIRTARGKEIRLIYKDATYLPAQIPALVNLPILPGLPEYAVYSQPIGALAPYLPRVYLAEELIPTTQYRYLLEDLSQGYHMIHQREDVIRSSAALSRLHQALKEWCVETQAQDRGLLYYGERFSRALQKYILANLEAYSQRTDDPALKSLLGCWPQIAELHLQPEFFELQPPAVIHGDTNFSNIHIHNRDPFQFKLVDWEWAGIGLPHADLASLLKGMSEEVEPSAVRRFFGSRRNPHPCLNPDLSFQENRRLYLWCKLERGLLDAAFLASQQINATFNAEFSLPDAINQSLLQVLDVYRQLTNGS